MIVYAIVLAVVVGVIEVAGWKLPDPWRKIVWIGIVVLLVFGILAYLLPGFPYLGRY